MICGIHYFITKLNTKIDVIPRSRFKKNELESALILDDSSFNDSLDHFVFDVSIKGLELLIQLVNEIQRTTRAYVIDVKRIEMKICHAL